MWTHVKTRLTDHRDREAQDRIFEATIERLRTHQTVSLEGGPGTGKSLFAAVMCANAVLKGSRVFYVPRTKAQQDMIENETIPRMEAFLPQGYAVLKGRSEYFCQRRADKAGFTLERRKDGTRGYYTDLLSEDWALVCSSSEGGCGKECYGDAYEAAKARAAEATMVITNQSVLAINHVLGNMILQHRENDLLLVDEAHLLPGTMSDALGGSLTVRRLEQAWKVSGPWLPEDLRMGLDRAARRLNACLIFPSEPWSDFASGRVIQNEIGPALQHVNAVIDDLWETARERPDPDLKGLQRRLGALYKDASFLVEPSKTHSVVIVAKTHGKMAVEAKQFYVQTEAQAMFSGFRKTVLMSATMGGLATKLLGIDEPVTGPAPFDARGRRLVYHPTWKPVENGPHQWSEDELRTLVAHSKGGALVIASANTQKDRAAEVLRAEGWSVGVQSGGGEDVRRLVSGLKDGTYDVVVGVDSVGTGIDVPGDALRLVVILSAFNPNPFSDMHLKMWQETFPNKSAAWRELFTPMCEEKTEQAIGRLLRTPEDRGVVAFLDPRVLHRNRFRTLAAPSRFTGDLNDVKEFFDAR